MISCNAITEKKIGSTGCPYIHRRKGNFTTRDRLLDHRRHICPGNVYHHVFNRERIFKKYVNIFDYTVCGTIKSHRLYTMYWRSHEQAYHECCKHIKNSGKK